MCPLQRNKNLLSVNNDIAVSLSSDNLSTSFLLSSLNNMDISELKLASLNVCGLKVF